MDYENSEAPDSARTDIPTEHIRQIENEEQAPLEKITNNQDIHMENNIMDTPPSPPLTYALEALLGGLDPPADTNARTFSTDDPVEQQPRSATPGSQPEIEKLSGQIKIPGLPSLNGGSEHTEPTPAVHEPLADIHAETVPAKEANPDEATHTPNDAFMEDLKTDDTRLVDGPAPAEYAEVACAGEVTSAPAVENSTAPADVPTEEEAEHPEWEVDSSPIESSSDDSSSDDSSSDESDEGDNTYKLLSPEEQAKILMAGDAGSDDEGEKPKGSGGQIRTKNEVPEEVIPKPDVTITADMKISELGSVETIVENILLIKAKTSGEYKVLESGSVLCLEDRNVIGVVAETLGRVQQPLYSVLFTNAGEITAAGLSIDTKVFYSEQHSTYVFTQALKAYKGSDASNLHDEEVGDEEMEFSDDEAEAEHKKRVKQKKTEKRGGKMQQSGGSGRAHPLQQQRTPYDACNGISYDDADDDGPYKPLSRPAGYADSVGRSEAPQEGSYSGERLSPNQNRDQFRGRGRGDRGRGRGDRGRGRGGYQNHRGGSNGYSLPPPSERNQLPPSGPGMFSQAPFQLQGSGFTAVSPPIVPPPNFFNMPSAQQYSPHQPQLPAWTQFPPPPFSQQPYSQPFQNGQSWPNIPAAAASNGGAFINPAFFNNQNPPAGQWNNQGQGRGRGNGGAQR
jgi:H/ACA ribonucleoprotein complex non-core subunit NAF1